MSDTSQVKRLIDQIKTNGTTLATDLVALAKAEITPSAKHAGVGGGMFGAAGYFALNAVSLLFLAGAGGFAVVWTKFVGLSMLVGVILGLCSMALVLLLLALGLALAGRNEIKQVRAPEATIAEAKATLETLKVAAAEGKAVVQSNALAARTIRQARRALD